MDFYVALLLFVVVVVLYLVSTVIKPANYPPGPSRLPIVGNTFLIKKLSQKLGGQYKALMKLSEQYNTNILGLKLGSDQYVVVFGRKLVQQVFTRDEFQGRPDGFFIRLRTMGEKRGITMTDGPLWQEQRNFAERQLRQLGFGKIVMESLMQDEMSALLSDLGDSQDNASLNHKLSSSVLNVLWKITGGKEFCKEEDRLSEFLDLLKERSKAFDMAGGLLNQIPWLRFVMPEYSGYNVIKNLNAKLFELFQGIINDHENTLKKDETRDFVDAYLHEKQQSKTGNFTDDQLIAICLDFFIAGALTTSYTLDFAFLQATKHPIVQQKLHEEIDRIVPRGHMPSLADRARMPYVEAVLLESQRFQHVVPTAGPRRTLRDTTLNGYRIPKVSDYLQHMLHLLYTLPPSRFSKNTILLLSLRSVHYDRERWSDPEVFRPERFLNEEGQLVPDEGLCPFGLGKRRCPGEVLAKSFLFVAFAAIFQKYYLSFPGGKEPTSETPGAGILLTPQPYTVCLRSRP